MNAHTMFTPERPWTPPTNDDINAAIEIVDALGVTEGRHGAIYMVATKILEARMTGQCEALRREVGRAA